MRLDKEEIDAVSDLRYSWRKTLQVSNEMHAMMALTQTETLTLTLTLSLSLSLSLSLRPTLTLTRCPTR